jgi:nucleoside-diphosphate-sugar epimerase
VFLGRAVARQAVAAGHDVTCVARGESGEPVAGVRFVPADRDDPDGLAPLRGGNFDAVIDVSRRPSHARHAVASLRDSVGHAVYVSSLSVYADVATPGQRVDNSPTMEPFAAGRDEADISTDPDAYGQAKVASEEMFREGFGTGRVFVCRAGLIEGPEDVMGRYSYWVRRLAAGQARPSRPAHRRARPGRLVDPGRRRAHHRHVRRHGPPDAPGRFHGADGGRGGHVARVHLGR